MGEAETRMIVLAEDILNQIDEALTDGAPVVALLDQADLLGGDRRSAIGFTPMFYSIRRSRHGRYRRCRKGCGTLPLASCSLSIPVIAWHPAAEGCFWSRSMCSVISLAYSRGKLAISLTA